MSSSMSSTRHLRNITTDRQSRRASSPPSPAWPLFLGLGWAALIGGTAEGHDIPNQRVDRSIQVTVKPGDLQVDYEVGLTELTLTQDLRSLTGGLPGGDRSAWLALYGQVTGPLNAKGLLVTVDGRPVSLAGEKYDLVIEEHPRYTFRYQAKIGTHGQLSIRDTNYNSSEGTSRLAVRGVGGIRIDGDDLPTVVDQILIRPVWQLSDEEERRTKQVEVRFETASIPDLAAATDRNPSAHRTYETRGKDGSAKLTAPLKVRGFRNCSIMPRDDRGYFSL